MATKTTYTLRSGEIVTSKDGEWPTQYANRTQAERAATKIGNGAMVIQRGRPFYVALTLGDGPTTDFLARVMSSAFDRKPF